MTSKMNLLEIIEYNEALRVQNRVKHTRKLIETFCKPKDIVEIAIKDSSFLAPFDYEILDAGYVKVLSQSDGDSDVEALNRMTIPRSVVIRDKASHDIVLRFTIAEKSMAEVLDKFGGARLVGIIDRIEKDGPCSEQQWRKAFSSYDPFRNLRGREITTDVVAWNTKTSGSGAGWSRVNEEAIYRLESLKSALMDCPNDPAEEFMKMRGLQNPTVKVKTFKMQIKNIPDEPILEFLKALPGNGSMFPDYANSVMNAMPPGVPHKLARIKMKSMIKRGLVSGCACNCRGDFSIVERPAN